MKLCTVSGCENKYASKGYCFKHYSKWKTYGDPLTIVRKPAERVNRICSLCNKAFSIEKWRLKDGRGKVGSFCSRKCNYNRMGKLAARYKTGKTSHKCRNCSKEFLAFPYAHRIYCGKECRHIDMGKRQSGVNSPAYKHGKSAGRIYGTFDYENWRKLVIERDNNKCRMCGLVDSTNQTDHIISISLDRSKAFDLDNGQVLCVECHKEKTRNDWQLLSQKRKMVKQYV